MAAGPERSTARAQAGLGQRKRQAAALAAAALLTGQRQRRCREKRRSGWNPGSKVAAANLAVADSAAPPAAAAAIGCAGNQICSANTQQIKEQDRLLPEVEAAESLCERGKDAIVHRLSGMSERSTLSPTSSVSSTLTSEDLEKLGELMSKPPHREVHFNHEADTVHEITPYAEIYGIHPRLFDFDKGFWMVPSKGFCPPVPGTQEAEEEDSECSSSDDEEGDWVVVREFSVE